MPFLAEVLMLHLALHSDTGEVATLLADADKPRLPLSSDRRHSHLF